VIARCAADDYAEAVEGGPTRSVGANIRGARLRAGIKTQAELAKRLGVPQPQLSDWENDRYGTPDVKTMLRIASAIGCSLDDLLEGLSADYDAQLQNRAPVGLTPTHSAGPVKISYEHQTESGAKSVESVLHHPLPDNQHPGEGSAYADSSASASPDSRPDSTALAARSASFRADVRAAYETRLIAQLFAAAQAVADALRDRAVTPPLRTKRSPAARSDSGRAKRRGGRRA
jgi:transcriptional regulator with XRE-family HTH domain